MVTTTMLPDGREGVLIAIKAVPGASRDEVVGRLGERLKVRIAAAPEGGRANRAICELLAAALGVRVSDVEVIQGQARAEKLVRVAGVRVQDVQERC